MRCEQRKPRGARLSHGTPDSTAAIGDAGAAAGYHSPIVSADGAYSSSEPFVTARAVRLDDLTS